MSESSVASSPVPNMSDSLMDKYCSSPVVLQCGNCKAVIGDTSSITAYSSKSETLTLTTAQGVKYNQDCPLTSCVGDFLGCTYYLVACEKCNDSLGRIYVTTPSHLDPVRDSFTFELDRIESYQIGSAQMTFQPIMPNQSILAVVNRQSSSEPVSTSISNKVAKTLTDDMQRVKHALLSLGAKLAKPENGHTISNENQNGSVDKSLSSSRQLPEVDNPDDVSRSDRDSQGLNGLEKVKSVETMQRRYSNEYVSDDGSVTNERKRETSNKRSSGGNKSVIADRIRRATQHTIFASGNTNTGHASQETSSKQRRRGIVRSDSSTNMSKKQYKEKVMSMHSNQTNDRRTIGRVHTSSPLQHIQHLSTIENQPDAPTQRNMTNAATQGGSGAASPDQSTEEQQSMTNGLAEINFPEPTKGVRGAPQSKSLKHDFVSTLVNSGEETGTTPERKQLNNMSLENTVPGDRVSVPKVTSVLSSASRQNKRKGKVSKHSQPQNGKRTTTSEVAKLNQVSDMFSNNQGSLSLDGGGSLPSGTLPLGSRHQEYL